jgi:long-chain acyl-CoA synthetase
VYPGFHAATQPDKPAVVMGRSGETITYRELDQRSARLAQRRHQLREEYLAAKA